MSHHIPSGLAYDVPAADEFRHDVDGSTEIVSVKEMRIAVINASGKATGYDRDDSGAMESLKGCVERWTCDLSRGFATHFRSFVAPADYESGFLQVGEDDPGSTNGSKMGFHRSNGDDRANG
jgi:hypothetical protein